MWLRSGLVPAVGMQVAGIRRVRRIIKIKVYRIAGMQIIYLFVKRMPASGRAHAVLSHEVVGMETSCP